jgi:potassium channel LctB
MKKRLGKSIAQKHIEQFSKLEKFFYEKPLVKIPIFVVSIILILFLVPVIAQGRNWESYLSLFFIFLLNVYLFFFIIFILRHTLKSLFKAENMWRLFASYLLFVVCVLLLFSFGYRSIEKQNKGYLTYGKCSDYFEPSMIEKDSSRATNYLYFSAITLFTVGYGDICPMGWDKWLAMVNAFIGNFISVVLMVVVITAYVNRVNK